MFVELHSKIEKKHGNSCVQSHKHSEKLNSVPISPETCFSKSVCGCVSLFQGQKKIIKKTIEKLSLE